MAAVLLTLAQAKSHLRITTTDADVDIQLKLDQAEAIILRYLKNPLTSIDTITATNPAVVTTLTSHGLTSGLTYTLSGTTTTPDVNGARVITVIDPTSFSVPVNVTSGQTAAAGIVSTPVWTAAAVPLNVTAAILLLLGSLYELRGDDQTLSEPTWVAIERLLVGLRDPALA